ncbi:MAG: ABC-type sugar transport system periplasmic component-like protein [Frankiales bacterium]|nr:ABC-type sugar transport system periplasmic component-like protein [Frankiales bacterium]
MYTFRRRPRTIAALAVGAMLLAGCSTGSGSTPSSAGSATGGSGGSDAVSAAVVANIQKFMGPSTFTAPGPAIDISTLKGKKIYDIPSVANPFVQSISASMEEVANKVGMKYTRFDNQSQVSQWVQGINQAIASKQDVIVLNGAPDPRALQPQLAAAKAAKIPVIVMHFHDNSAPLPPACEGCANVTATVSAPFNDAGKAAADWIIKDSGGQANVLIVGGSDILPSPGTIKTMTDEFSAQCSTCTTKVTNIPVADWNTKTQGVVQSALQANPKVNYVYVLYDAMVAGAVPAITTLGKKIKIVSYNGSPFALDDIRQSKGSVVAMDVGEDTPGIGYATMDQAFRVLLGKPTVEERTPIRIWDNTNVAEAGTPAKAGQGYGNVYTSGYLKLWGLSS